MKNSFLKIAIAIVIAIALIFIIATAIMAFRFDFIATERVGTTLLCILAIVCIGLSAYTVITLFGAGLNVKTMVIDSDSFSAVCTTSKVVRNLVKKCVTAIEGARLVKIKIVEDDKPGFKLTVKIKLADSNLAEQTAKLKYLIEDSFIKELNFTFNSITIKVTALKNSFTPDVEAADKYLADKAKEEECKASCKIADPSPSEEEFIDQVLTPQEIEKADIDARHDNEDVEEEEEKEEINA